MANFTWKIPEISATDGLITHAKYHVTAQVDNESVETEGNWYFNEPTLKTPFVDVTEAMVAGWIEAESYKDGVNVIKSALEEQLARKSTSVVPPWKPQVFTLEQT